MDDYRIVERKSGNVLTMIITDSGKTGSLPAEAAPGSVCYTADLSFMATKDIDGQWKQIGA